jgi:LDH2 family malate/lactate/ureidoglycolate dehydrogenase
MPVFSADQLTGVFNAMADHFGMNTAEKSAWAEASLLAELFGNLMQGLAYFEHHNLFRITNGVTNLGATPRVVKELPGMAILDAEGGLGPFVGRIAMELACQKAKTSGAYMVAVRNSADWNMISYPTLQALKHDCVGIVICNSRPEVAPWGGTTPVYGMNPFSVAIPTGRHFPIFVDMSSSNSGGLSAWRHLILKDSLPDTIQFFDKTGRIVKDPKAWGTTAGWGLDKGAQRMAGYRDMALTVITDSIGGALTGMKCAMDLGVPELLQDSPRTPRGQMVMAMNVEHFTPLDEFKAKIDRAIDQAKASPLEPGSSDILMPGEREFREEQRRRKSGIPVLDKVWSRVGELMKARGVDIDKIAGPPMNAEAVK